MKNYLKKGLDFLLFGNFFVAFCAIAQVLYTYRFFSIKPNVWVCCFLFFSTLAYYNFCLLISKPPQNLYLQNQRLNWFFTNYNLNVGVTIVAAIVLIPLFLMINYEAKTLVFFLGILSAAYVFPLHRQQSKLLSLRKIKGVKLFLIAFVWALSVIWLPVWAAGIYIPQSEILPIFFKQFLLFVAITIPFDVRDFIEDKSSNLKTLPVIYGANKAYAFAIILLALNLLLVFCFKNPITEGHFFESIFTPILAVYIILKSSLRKNPYYYFLYLDGILIVQYLILLIASTVK